MQTILTQSRASTTQQLDFSAMAQLHQSCQEEASVLTSNIISQAVGGDPLMGDVLTGVLLSLVSAQMREAVFQSLHSFHYQQVWATQMPHHSQILLAANGQDTNGRDLLFCQRVKVKRNVQLQPAAVVVTHRRIANIHVDLVRPLPPSNGHTYLFTVIDRTSRWPETIPLFSITLQTAPKPSFPSGSPVLGASHHHILQKGSVHMGSPLQPAQHQPFANNSIPPTIKRVGRVVPQSAERCLTSLGCCRQLVGPPSLSDVGCSHSFP